MAEVPWSRAEKKRVVKNRIRMEASFARRSSRARTGLWVHVSRLVAEDGFQRTGLECNHRYEKIRRNKEGRAISQEVREELAAEKKREQQEIVQRQAGVSGVHAEVEIPTPEAPKPRGKGLPDLNLAPPDSPQSYRSGGCESAAAVVGESSRAN